MSRQKQRTATRISLFLMMILLLGTAIPAQSYAAGTGASGHSNLKAATSSTPYATGRVDARAGAFLRKSASVYSSSVAVLDDNAPLTIHKEVFTSSTSSSDESRWYYVTAGKVKGYIRADLVDGMKFKTVTGTVTRKLNYRKGAGTSMKKAGTFKKGKTVTVYLAANPVKSARGPSDTWYRIKYNKKWVYVTSAYLKLTSTSSTGSGSSKSTGTTSSSTKTTTGTTAASTAGTTGTKTGTAAGTSTGTKAQSDPSILDEAKFEASLILQGFPSEYKTKLRALHKKHPNWVFQSYKTGLKWSDALAKQTRSSVSLIHKSQPGKYRKSNYAVEPGWYNATNAVVAYYMDPRNFLTEGQVYMFEDLSYNSKYQTSDVVERVILPSKLPKYGFTTKIFMDAGKKYKISPVFLAARARQETGGGSVCIYGTKYNGKVVYNPFNIGATGKDPATNGLRYARNMGWTTQAKSVNGAASYLASGYINKKQNSIYFQRFNVCNGLSNCGTHQYMTNIQAPYNEASMTKTSYTQLGITNEPMVFTIPIYTSMPSSTKLP